ncbi:MAG: nitroreductase family protein [Nanobdellota archaeon]
MDAIKSRRSVRKFLDREVDKKTIEELLAKATFAPNGKNRQPWKIVVMSGQTKKEFVKVCNQAVGQKQAMTSDTVDYTLKTLEEVPIVLLIYRYNYEEKEGPIRATTNTLSVGAFVQTLLLAATQKGLGSLWVGEVQGIEDEINKWLNKDIGKLVSAIALGYTEEKPSMPNRRAVEEISYWLD